MTGLRFNRRSYRANVGLNYPGGRPGSPEKRAEAGDVISDLPSRAIPELLKLGYISEVELPAKDEEEESD